MVLPSTIPQIEIPIIKELILYRWNILLIPVLQIHANRGPDNQGPPVPTGHRRWFKA